MANFTLACRDSYLEYLHASVKQDTLTALHSAAVHLQSLFPDQLIIKAEEEVFRSEERLLLASLTESKDVFIRMLPVTELLISQTGSPASQLGSEYVNVNRERKVVASLPLSHRNRSRVLNHINDNYCVKCVTGLKDCACVSGQIGLNPSPVMAGNRDLTSKSETVNLLVNSCVANAHSVIGLPQKKGVIPNYCHNYTEIKYVKDVSCVGHLSSVNLVTNVPTVTIELPVGARQQQFGKNWNPWGQVPR